MDYTNKALGLRVQTQIPLDVKEYSQNENTLANLGIANNLAFTYTKGLIVYCIDEGTRYEWKEMEIGDIGLIPTNFTYPSGHIAFGINYSNKQYNFVKVEQVIPEFDQNNFVRNLYINLSDIPDYNLDLPPTSEQINEYLSTLPNIEKTLADTDSKWNLIFYTTNPT